MTRITGWKRFIGKPTAYPFGHGLSYTSWTFAMDKAPMQDTATGSVGPYSETLHPITFAPLKPGYFREAVAVRFEGCDTVIKLTTYGGVSDEEALTGSDARGGIAEYHAGMRKRSSRDRNQRLQPCGTG